MRISRLFLGRYGHLSDVDLTFPTGTGLHVVLGANEAGKSTALAAIGDCLFGIPPQTPFAFRRDTGDLRVGITLCAVDGREATFVRGKRRRNDLLDGQDRPLPESAIAAFLAGATRERFNRFFGLNAAALRSGGEEILKGEGEVGESILQAHTGLHGFRALVGRLDKDAGRLFGDRRGKRELHAAADAFKEAKRELDERSVEPTEHRRQRGEQARIEAADAANAREARALQAERSRLDRIRRTAPARRALTRALEEREEIGPVPAFPPDAEQRRLAAIAAREQTARDLFRECANEEAVRIALEELAVDDRLLAEADQIDALAAERSRVAHTQRDREEQRNVARQHAEAIEEIGRRLGRTSDVADLIAKIPDSLARAAADAAVTAQVRLSERQTKAAEARDDAQAHLKHAGATLAALPDPEPAAELRDAIDRAKREGRIDAEHASAVAAVQEARAGVEQALAALPLWSGTAEALAAAPVPLVSLIEARGDAQVQAQTERASRQADVTTAEKSLHEIAAELGALVVTGEVPTADAIAGLRERRDGAWRLIRRHRLDAGAPPADDELDGIGPAASLPDTFETLLRDADGLADLRMVDAQRVAAFEQLRARRTRETASHARAVEAADAADARCDVAAEQWRALWEPLGVEPQNLAAMREWLRRRDAVLGLHRAVAEASRKLADVEARHAAAWSRLAVLLPADAASVAGNMADLVSAAERICVARERQEAARADAEKSVEAARAAVDKAERTCAQVEAALAAWRTEWAAVATVLGLSASTPAESGKRALDLWNEIEKKAAALRDAENRIQQMTLLIDGFVEQSAEIVRRVAPDLAHQDMHDALRSVVARLAEARTAARKRTDLSAQREALEQVLRKLDAAHAEADGALAGLHALARTTDDAALRDAIARAARCAAVAEEISDHEAELRQQGDGKSADELDEEAAGVDLDVAPARIVEIEERLSAIHEENVAHAGQLATIRATLDKMAGGNDAAGAAQAMHDALSEIDDIAARYVRLRLAHTLLRAGIDRFRRQQQAPLLGRASQLFARLTEGRYDRLDAEEQEDGKLVLLALSPDGSKCPADRLSDGTRDQLYLALRLAAIESYAVRTEPLPFIADDLLVNFDDRRTRAAMRVLGEFARVTQTILFTHHAHVVELADPDLVSVHHLPAGGALASSAALVAEEN